MGMFDEIRVRVPLPIDLPVDHREHWFQTKSLGRSCEHYEITEDGVLCLVPKPGQLQPMFFSGIITFYTIASHLFCEQSGVWDEHGVGWLECMAGIECGKVQSVSLVEYRKPGKFTATQKGQC